ncbi:mammalian cell entry protein [Mycolicibacterium novocastrense]|uniref:MCE family protein n=1 Tax=Mycolicibacterium novocastrense TaxID=59813 RepID=UPI000749FEEE|nr:MCE family protein [Mycolicibacterium novocastrense]KUH64350.1 mammalian cell entry protein [Mycolicibacterium novocastrense]KUH65146.1 mammalian cell entry protein [Mycolicibacterium novocastrense]KUH76186.1 mammalian cell entry protein [Mycolicibacterium novocastrense]
MSTVGTAAKFGVFVAVMSALTASLFLVFGEFRGGSTSGYSAVFADASSVEPGDSVRVAGVRVGTVRDVVLRPDNTVVVAFDADDDVVLTTGTRAAVRYLNLVGDRYLELVDGPGSTRVMAAGAQIPVDRTQPALDLDLLLGGLKPVIRGLNPTDVNQLTGALLQIFQGQGGTLNSLMGATSSFSNTLADNNAALERLIDNLDRVLANLGREGDRFSGALDRFERLTTELAVDRDTIGTAIESLSAGTASVAALLSGARPPLAATVDQLNRLAPQLEEGKGQIDVALQRAPENYRKLARVGSYGSFVNYYLCGISVRVTDLQGRTAVFPWVKQRHGRCAEPDA